MLPFKNSFARGFEEKKKALFEKYQKGDISAEEYIKSMKRLVRIIALKISPFLFLMLIINFYWRGFDRESSLSEYLIYYFAATVVFTFFMGFFMGPKLGAFLANKDIKTFTGKTKRP